MSGCPRTRSGAGSLIEGPGVLAGPFVVLGNFGEVPDAASGPQRDAEAMNHRTNIKPTGIGAAALSLTVIAALAVAVGSLGTWVTADVADASASGLEKDGPILLVLVAVVVCQVAYATIRGFKRPSLLLLSVGAAVLAVAIGFADIADVQDNSVGGLVEVGWGLRLAAYASIPLLIGTLGLMLAARSSRAAQPSFPPAPPLPNR